MKKIIFFIAGFLLMVNTFSQTPILSKEEYLVKSREQKTGAIVMLIGGGFLMFTGISLYEPPRYLLFWSGSGPAPRVPNNNEAAVITFLIGLSSALGSIPVLNASARNRRRAEATIHLNHQELLLPQQNNFGLKIQPAIGFKITWR